MSKNAKLNSSQSLQGSEYPETSELRIIRPGESILTPSVTDSKFKNSQAGDENSEAAQGRKILRWDLSLKNDEVEDKPAPHGADENKCDEEDNEGLEFESVDSVSLMKSKDVLSTYYFKVQNHYELFKIGSTFLQDYKNGINRFAFCHVNRLRELQESVLAIAAFFNYHIDKRVVIVTDDFERSAYKFLLKDDLHKEEEEVGPGQKLEIYRLEGLDLVDYKKLGAIIQSKNYADGGKLLTTFLKKRDVCLFELPGIAIVEKEREQYFPLIQMLRSITFVMGGQTGRSHEIQKMIDYYSKYDVPFKGVIWSDKEKKQLPHFFQKIKKRLAHIIFEQQ